MGLLSVTNVATAIAPFKKVRDNLRSVLNHQIQATLVANKRLEGAAAEYARTESILNGQKAEAQLEAARAEKLLAKLDALLSED